MGKEFPHKPVRFYLERQERFESNARSYPRRLPLAIRKAKGIHITDTEGREYIDCLAGAGTLALGHNHPVIVEAIRHHLEQEYPLHTLDLTTPVKDAFVEELFATLPDTFARRAKIQFCGPSGADAVEAALKLVKTATGRRSILGFHGAYHGQTHGTLSLMGNLGPKEAISGLMSDVHFLPYPNRYRCSFGCSNCDGSDSSAYIENLLDDPESGIVAPAAMIFEAVQGEGGCIPAPEKWLQEMRRLTRDRRIPLIVDEIQTGWGRTGKLYAFEHAGIMPDVIVLSKALGGSLPLAVIVYHEDLDRWAPGAHTGTFRGNQLAMATGLATLRFLLENDLAAHATDIGDLLRLRLCDLQRQFGFIGDVRGRGLMLGMEIVNPDQSDRWGRPVQDGTLARAIQSECFQRGLIIEVGGRHGSVLRLLPPLIISEADIDEIVDRLADACMAVADSGRQRTAHV